MAASRSRQLVAWFDRRYVHGPEPHSWWMGRGFIAFKPVDTRTVLLEGLWVEPRSRKYGVGREQLRVLCEQADERGLRIITWVSPFGHDMKKSLTTKQLEAWYARQGFTPTVFHRRHHLERLPGDRK